MSINMKYKAWVRSVILLVLFSLIFFIIFFYLKNKNLLGMSWIDERPSNIIESRFFNNSCLFLINYMADWEKRVILEEERNVTFLKNEEDCTNAFLFLTRPEMSLSVGAMVKTDGSWKIMIDHNGKFYDFEDEYITKLNIIKK